MKQKKIAYIDMSFFVHATEDENKVLEAARNIFPPIYAQQIVFSKNNLKGEYGNLITYFKTQIRKEEVMESFLKKIASDLTILDKEMLLRELNLHLEKGNLYIRVDKQTAFKSELKLFKADPIHIRIRFNTSNVEEIKENCRNIGILQ